MSKGTKALQLVGIFILAMVVIIIGPGIVNGDTQIMTVLSDSMSPDINRGDLIIVSKVDSAAIQVGDILTYIPVTYGPVITHRVMEITVDGEFVMKGDANRRNDLSSIVPEQVIGKCTRVIPYAGYIPYYVQKPIGYVLMILLPAIALIILIIKDASKSEAITLDCAPEENDIYE